jgi:hypothetical protein
VVFKVRQDSIDVIDFERAADALRLLPRRQHEVFDEKLAASVEQLGQRHFAIRPIENIFLVDLHPRQRPAFRGQLIAQPSQFLLPLEQISSRHQPYRRQNNLMLLNPFFRQRAHISFR